MVAGRAWQQHASELTQTVDGLPPPTHERSRLLSEPLCVCQRWWGGGVRCFEPTLTTAAPDSS